MKKNGPLNEGRRGVAWRGVAVVISWCFVFEIRNLFFFPLMLNWTEPNGQVSRANGSIHRRGLWSPTGRKFSVEKVAVSLLGERERRRLVKPQTKALNRFSIQSSYRPAHSPRTILSSVFCKFTDNKMENICFVKVLFFYIK